MDKWGMAEKVIFIGIAWAIILCMLFAFADQNARDVISDESQNDIMWALFGIYLGQTVQLVFYLTTPILLFFIACALLKD